MIKIVGGIVVVMVIVAVFFLGRNSSNNKQSKSTNEGISLSESPTLIIPKTVVENYMKSTLGTIFGSTINYEKGKTYLAEKLKKQFVDDSFIPTSYGIQNGPNDIKVESEEIDRDRATVIVAGIYGSETGVKWQFDLIKEQGEWKIVEIMNLSQ